MPWLVAPEIAKMLKVGGILFVETHFAFRAHKRPGTSFNFPIWACGYSSLRHLASNASKLAFQTLS